MNVPRRSPEPGHGTPPTKVNLSASSRTPEPDRRTVLTEATVRAAEHLGVSDSEVAKIVDVRKAAISKWRQNEDTLADGSEHFHAAAVFVRAFMSLDAIVGGDGAAARAWMRSPNNPLGRRPVEHMTTIEGLKGAAAHLDANRFRT